MNVEAGKRYRIVDNIDNFHYFEIGTIVKLVCECDYRKEPRWWVSKTDDSDCRQWVFTENLEEIK